MVVILGEAIALVSLSAADVTSGSQLLAALGDSHSAGVRVTVANHVSLKGVPIPAGGVLLQTNATVAGAGVGGNSSLPVELDFHGLADVIQLAPGVHLHFINISLVHLPQRPNVDPSQGANALTIPLWAINADRSTTCIHVHGGRVVVPTDEYLLLSHWATAGQEHSHATDVFSMLEHALTASFFVATGDFVAGGDADTFVWAALEGLGVQMASTAMAGARDTFAPVTNLSNSSPQGMTGGANAPGPSPAAPSSASSPTSPWVLALAIVGISAVAAGYALAVVLVRRRCCPGTWFFGSQGGQGGAAGGDHDAGPSSSAKVAVMEEGMASAEDLFEQFGGPPIGPSRSATYRTRRSSDLRAVRSNSSRSAGDAPLLRSRSETGKGACYMSSSFSEVQVSSSSSSALGGGGGGGGASALTNGSAAGRRQPLDELHDAVSMLNAQVDDRQLVIHDVLGQGAYGTVYKGMWRNLAVAVKTVTFQDRVCGNEKAQRRAIMEAAITSSISHPNVVSTYSYDIQPLVPAAPAALGQLGGGGGGGGGDGGAGLMVTAAGGGAGTNGSGGGASDWKLYIVQEYCNAGSLRSALDAKQLLWDPMRRCARLPELLDLCLDVASGLAHIHSKNIVHGDLNPSNVLLQSYTALSASTSVDSRPGSGAADLFLLTVSPSVPSVGCNCSGASFVAKIADFGLSIKMPDNVSHVSNLRQGTPFYAAPEVVAHGKITKSADIYSFGVLLWEVFHHKPPYKQHPSRGWVPRRGFPLFSKTCPLRLAQLAVACTNRDSALRPSIEQVLEVLREIQRSQELAVAPAAAGSASAPLLRSSSLPSAGMAGAAGGGGSGGTMGSSESTQGCGSNAPLPAVEVPPVTLALLPLGVPRRSVSAASGAPANGGPARWETGGGTADAAGGGGGQQQGGTASGAGAALAPHGPDGSRAGAEGSGGSTAAAGVDVARVAAVPTVCMGVGGEGIETPPSQQAAAAGAASAAAPAAAAGAAPAAATTPAAGAAASTAGAAAVVFAHATPVAAGQLRGALTALQRQQRHLHQQQHLQQLLQQQQHVQQQGQEREQGHVHSPQERGQGQGGCDHPAPAPSAAPSATAGGAPCAAGAAAATGEPRRRRRSAESERRRSVESGGTTSSGEGYLPTLDSADLLYGPGACSYTDDSDSDGGAGAGASAGARVHGRAAQAGEPGVWGRAHPSGPPCHGHWPAGAAAGGAPTP